jgi:hypothetical protein
VTYIQLTQIAGASGLMGTVSEVQTCRLRGFLAAVAVAGVFRFLAPAATPCEIKAHGFSIKAQDDESIQLYPQARR